MVIDLQGVTMDSIMPWQALLDEALAKGDCELRFTGSGQAKSALLALTVQWIRKALDKGMEPKIYGFPENVLTLAKVYGIMDVISPYLGTDSN